MQEKLYKIEKAPVCKNLEKVISKLSEAQIKQIIDLSENPKYLYWDKFKYKKLDNFGITNDIGWALVHKHRRLSARQTPIHGEEGEGFHFNHLKRFEKILHTFDKAFLNRPIDSSAQTESWMSEAISSAMIEGAHTTRDRALELLQLHKTPSDYAERMIVNNYKMANILENLPLDFQVDLKTLLDWQTQLTHQTLDKAGQGRLRDDADQIVIAPNVPEIVTFIPPKKAFLEKELTRLIDFINQENEDMHPLIQAICIHFWFAYLHPFVDGNGRTARALFYWFLMKSGYPNITSLPLSPIILKSLKQYSKAFIYSEQDDHDLTYFIDFNMGLIDEALTQFKLAKDSKKTDRESFDENLNLRQNIVLNILRNHELSDVNVSFVKQKFGVSKLTAINDLKELLEKGLLESRRAGKNVLYRLKI